MPNLPQQRDRLEPSEALFNPLPLPLADGVSRVLRRTSIDRAPTRPPEILRNVRRDSLGEWAGSLFGRTTVEVKADWEKVVGQIRYLLDEVSAVTKDYELKEITFQLGFSAEGKIVFVAKAGITTTISAKFTHK